MTGTTALPAVFDDSTAAWERALYAFRSEKQRRSGSQRTLEGYYRMLQHFFRRLGKTPDAVTSQDVFAFASIWSMWKDPEGNSIPTCAIITTSANALLMPIHHRMPVILPREMESFWLDRSIEDTTELRSVLTPYPDAAMEAYEVSTLVNSVANDGPELIARVA